ncbi:MAG: hypothetical protein M3N42_16730 [Cyanobacteriota bacterium]|nr:hypothetical protein [Cyanobacteriota bacterium]
MRARLLWRRVMMGFEILEPPCVCLLVVGRSPKVPIDTFAGMTLPILLSASYIFSTIVHSTTCDL